MFEPVNPVYIGKHWKFQGLFLQRQREVSADFSEFVTAKLITPQKLWRELCLGKRSKMLNKILVECLKEELRYIIGIRKFLIGDNELTDEKLIDWENEASKIQNALPDAMTGSVFL